ncbi:MAG: hypothetical protein JSR25_04385 [Proteobacteria bacterium]|nr:hypothetical protein [Pseudomonadota bacterium]
MAALDPAIQNVWRKRSFTKRDASRVDAQGSVLGLRLSQCGTYSRRAVVGVAAGKDLQTMPHKRRV